MTREEALQAMKDGKKVTHRLFKDKEYLYMTEGAILTQDYYNVGDETCEFWKAHSDSCWQKDWILFGEVEKAELIKETPVLIGVPNKKQFIIAFLNKNCFWSVKKAWDVFNEENKGFCSSIYFGKVWKEIYLANIEEKSTPLFLEEKQSIEEGLGESLGDKQINAVKNLIKFQEEHSKVKEEYQNKCVLCKKTFMGEQKSLVCPECTLKAKKQVLKDFVLDNEEIFKDAFDAGYQLCLQHEGNGNKTNYDNFGEWFITFKKQFE
jgi:hypothetical protein